MRRGSFQGRTFAGNVSVTVPAGKRWVLKWLYHLNDATPVAGSLSNNGFPFFTWAATASTAFTSGYMDVTLEAGDVLTDTSNDAGASNTVHFVEYEEPTGGM